MANGKDRKKDPPQEKPKRRRSIQEKRAAQIGPPKPSVLTQAINRAVGLERPTPQTQAATLTGKGSSLRGSIPRTQAQLTPPSTLTQQLPRPIRRGIETAKESPLGRMASTALKLTTEGDPTGGASAFDPVGPGKAVGHLISRPLRQGAEAADPIVDLLSKRSWLGQQVPTMSHTPYEFMAWDPVNPARGMPFRGEYSIEPTLNSQLETLLRAQGKPVPVRTLAPRELMPGEPVYLRLRNVEQDYSHLADDIARQAIPGVDERSVGSLLRHLGHQTPGAGLDAFGAYSGNPWRYQSLEDILSLSPATLPEEVLASQVYGVPDQAMNYLMEESIAGRHPDIYESILREAFSTGLAPEFNIRGAINEPTVFSGQARPGRQFLKRETVISPEALQQFRAPGASLESAAAGRAPKITTQKNVLRQMIDREVETLGKKIYGDMTDLTPQDMQYLERLASSKVLDDWWRAKGLPTTEF